MSWPTGPETSNRPAAPARPPPNSSENQISLLVAESGIARRAGRLAHTLSWNPTSDLPSSSQAPRDHQQRDQHAKMQPRSGDQDRHRGRVVEHLGLGKAIALRIAPGTGDQIDQDELRHIGQHQAGQDLVGVEARAQPGGDGGPGHAAQHAGQDHRRHQPARYAVVESQRPSPPPASAPIVYWPSAPMFQTLARKPSDSPVAIRISGRRLDQQLGSAVAGGQRLDEEGVERLAGVLAQDGEDQRRGDEREDDRQQRRAIAPRPGEFAARFKPKHAAAPSLRGSASAHHQADLLDGDLADRPRRRQPAAGDDRDAIADREDLVEILGDHHHGGAGGGKIEQAPAGWPPTRRHPRPRSAARRRARRAAA